MGVEDGGLTTRTPVFQELSHSEVRGLVEKLNLMDEVVWLPLQVNSVDMDSARLHFLIYRKRSVLGDHMNLDPQFHQFLAQIKNVRTDASHNAWWVFPGKHHYAEHVVIVLVARVRVKLHLIPGCLTKNNP